MGTICIKRKDVYGVTHIYALNNTRELETLTGQKTLTPRAMEALRGLGFQIRDMDAEIEMARHFAMA